MCNGHFPVALSSASVGFWGCGHEGRIRLSKCAVAGGVQSHFNWCEWFHSIGPSLIQKRHLIVLAGILWLLQSVTSRRETLAEIKAEILPWQAITNCLNALLGQPNCLWLTWHDRETVWETCHSCKIASHSIKKNSTQFYSLDIVLTVLPH